MDSTGITDRRFWEQDRATSQVNFLGHELEGKCEPPKACDVYFPVLEQAGRHHTEPMNIFLLRDLIQFVDSQTKKGIRIAPPNSNGQVYVYRWQRPRLMAPLKTPHDCRERNLPYHGAIMVDLWKDTYQTAKEEAEVLVEKTCVYSDFHLFNIPCMLGTCLDVVRDGLPHGWMYEAIYDTGAYYLCESSSNSSSERIMPLNLHLRYNHYYMFPGKSAPSNTTSGSTGEKKTTASKSYAAASTQYQKHKQQDNNSAISSSSSQQQDIRMELRCLHESRGLLYSTSTMYMTLTDYYAKKTDKKSHRLELQLQQFASKDGKKKKKSLRTIPVMTVMTALGWTAEQCRGYLQWLHSNWIDGAQNMGDDCDRILHYVFERHRLNGPKSAKQALIEIGQLVPQKEGSTVLEEKHIKLGHGMLCNHLLPFIGMDMTSYPSKARYVLYLWWIAMMRMTKVDKSQDDHDHEINQRYETNAALFGSLIRRALRHYLTCAESALKKYHGINLRGKSEDEQQKQQQQQQQQKKAAAAAATAGPNGEPLPIRWDNIFKEKWLSKRLFWCLSTGIWSPKQIKKNTRRNLTQSLGRLNDATYSSYLRRITTPIKAQDKSIKPRMIHISHYGRADAADTSEGEKSGSVRSATDGFMVSQGSNSSLFWEVIQGDLFLTQPFATAEPSFPGHGGMLTLVVLNGVPKGWIRHPATLVQRIRSERRNGHIHREISVCWQRDHQSVVYILTEPGRSLRPLICLERYVANMHRVQNHADLFAYGIIEYIDALEERSLAIAFSATDMKERPMEVFTHCELDPAFVFGYSMNTPFTEADQAPRVTFNMNMTKQALGSHIHNPLRYQTNTVALFYVQRALISSGLYHEASHGINLAELVCTDVTDEDNMVFNLHLAHTGAFLGYNVRSYQTRETETEKIEKPEKPRRDSNVQHLMRNGLSEIGAMLKAGDTIVGRTTGTSNTAERKDDSIEVRMNDEGQVLRHIRVGSIQRSFILSMLHMMRGDKFSSRHGQKVTLSLLRLAADMPYNCFTGEFVDVILTLVCLAGRMTAGQLHELEFSVRNLEQARFQSGRAYSTARALYKQNLENSLVHYGKYGNGRTGHVLENTIYRGYIFQARLKHLVRDKEHARGVGPVMLVTRQPTEARWQNSGLRFGEMERDCLVAYGAAWNALGRYFFTSDGFWIYICCRCGIFGRGNRQERFFECPLCHRSDLLIHTAISAATKAFFQEMQALGIYARFEVNHSPLFCKSMDKLLDTSDCQPPALKNDEEDGEALLDRFVSLCIEEENNNASHRTGTSSSSSSSSTTTKPKGGSTKSAPGIRKRTRKQQQQQQTVKS